MASVRPPTGVQAQAQEAPLRPPSPPAAADEHVAVPSGAPRDTDYGQRLRAVEQLVSAPDWRGADEGGGVRTDASRERVEALSSATLFPSDPRVAFVLLNEARYRVIQGVLGVRRDQVNVMTLIATMILAEAVQTKTQVLRRGLRRPTRADLILGDGLLNVVGQQIAGPSSREIPFFAVLIGTAAVGTVATRVVRHAAHDMKAASHRVKRGFRYLMPRSTRSGRDGKLTHG